MAILTYTATLLVQVFSAKTNTKLPFYLFSNLHKLAENDCQKIDFALSLGKLPVKLQDSIVAFSY